MEDFNKEETASLEALYEAFTSTFNMTRSELEEELCNWPGELLSYYDYCMEFKYDNTICKSVNQKEVDLKK
jgi:hypothetical protein